MRERAKQTLLKLKEKDKAVEKIFNEYVSDLEKELEIPKELAATLVADELTNRFERKLILHSLFNPLVIEENGVDDKNEKLR